MVGHGHLRLNRLPRIHPNGPADYRSRRSAPQGDHGLVSMRWNGAPPEEAYGRVTDPGRFAGLHEVAGVLLDELQERFDVVRETGLEPDRHGEAPAPVVRLVPRDPAAASLAVAFTAFPGLVVRLGRTADTAHLPMCGCDACDETVEECTEQLQRFVDAVTSGAFRERLVHDGGWWHERWYEAGRWANRSLVDDVAQLARLRAELPGGERTWRPWVER